MSHVWDALLGGQGPQSPPESDISVCHELAPVKPCPHSGSHCGPLCQGLTMDTKPVCLCPPAGAAGWDWCWPARASACWQHPSSSCTTRKATSCTISSSPAARSSASSASSYCLRAGTRTCPRTSPMGSTTRGSRSCRTRRGSSPSCSPTPSSRTTRASTKQRLPPLQGTGCLTTPRPMAWSPVALGMACPEGGTVGSQVQRLFGHRFTDRDLQVAGAGKPNSHATESWDFQLVWGNSVFPKTLKDQVFEEANSLEITLQNLPFCH